MLNILQLNKPNITDFGHERNELLDKSKSEWNLFLDSDESISNHNVASSAYFQFPISNEFSSYQLPRKTYFLGKLIGIDYPTRLVRKGTGKWVRAVHEVWLPKKSHLAGVMFDNYIIHNTANNLSDYLLKINNYSTLHAKANLDEGKRSNLFKIIFFPIGKFAVTLVKSKHVVFSIMQSLHSYLSWTKLYFLQS